jgi:predicted small integral membrane protein
MTTRSWKFWTAPLLIIASAIASPSALAQQSGFGSTWMYWTGPTATFFGAIAAMLGLLTVLEFVYPTVERKGFLPIATTRGDRVFQSLLGSAYIHVLWLLFTGGAALWGATIISLIFAVVMLRWG